jgi:hypothetical protein
VTLRLELGRVRVSLTSGSLNALTGGHAAVVIRARTNIRDAQSGEDLGSMGGQAG